MNPCIALSDTGVDLLPTVLLGIALLLAGAAALLLTRRRGRATLGALAVAGIVVAALTFSAPQAATAADCPPAPVPPAAANVAPVALDDAASVTEDGVPNPVNGNLLANDSDADGDTLSVANAGTVTLSYGSLLINARGGFTYTLDNSNPVVDALADGQQLADSFTYTLSDGHGHTASATLSITINGTTDNRPPVVVADTNTVKEDAAPNPVTGNVLTNDTDPDGHTMAVANAGTVTLSYGTLVINATGSYTYTLDNSNPVLNALNDGQQLTDTFTYTASDGHGGTASGTVTIVINGTTDNRPPVTEADTNTIKEDAVPNFVTGNVLTNDTDLDGDTMYVPNTGTFTLTYGFLGINADGSYRYTLDNSNSAVNALNTGQQLTDTFTYTASDGHGGTASSTLTIRIDGTTDNRPPVVDADVDTIKEDAVPDSVTGNVLGNDADPDGNTLSVANAGTVTLTYGSLVINANGSYSYTLDNSNAVVNALNDGQQLSDTFTYTASDGHGGTASSTLTIRIDGTTDLIP